MIKRRRAIRDRINEKHRARMWKECSLCKLKKEC